MKHWAVESYGKFYGQFSIQIWARYTYKITPVLKIAKESVTLELCDLHNYFASSLLVKKTD